MRPSAPLAAVGGRSIESAQRRQAAFGGERDRPRRILAHLFGKHRDVVARRQADDLQAVPVRIDDRQRAGADRARRPENRNAPDRHQRMKK